MLNLLCHIFIGAGALNLLPGIVESPRYADTLITISDDIVLDGPLDRQRSYRHEGLTVTRNGNPIDVTGPQSREHLVVDSAGRLLWTILSFSDSPNIASVSIFQGQCESVK